MALVWCVEDDKSINELYSCVLSSYGHGYEIFESGEPMLEKLSEKRPDLILLDVMLEGEDGFSLLTKIKSNPSSVSVPVLFVSARDDELSKVRGLNLGADDYIAKPFSVLELMARINVNLRGRTNGDSPLSYRDITVDNARHITIIGGEEVTLPKKEYMLLEYLVKNAGRTLSRENIFREVWGEDFLGETRTLDMHVMSLRNKLKECEIKTLRGVGFMLV